MNKIEIENKIKDLKAQMKKKLLERGEAIQGGGGWHDNAALESMIRRLNELLLNIKE